MEKKKLYKCAKCELNYVEKEGEICQICKKQTRNDGYYAPNRHYSSTCYSCGKKLSSDTDKFCPKCGYLICSACGSCFCDKV